MNDFRSEADLLINFDKHSDVRGDLVILNFDFNLPFTPVRFFFTYNVPVNTIRGGHAHRTCEQLLIATSGSLQITLFKDNCSTTFLLDSPSIGLYIPAMTWGVQHDHSPQNVLSVFASEAFDSAEYIQEFNEFQELSENL
jgi:UDP-2-acetamido-3-amino-2,3-dideoxy-glucuronate N-acetyltransferase